MKNVTKRSRNRNADSLKKQVIHHLDRLREWVSVYGIDGPIDVGAIAKSFELLVGSQLEAFGAGMAVGNDAIEAFTRTGSSGQPTSKQSLPLNVGTASLDSVLASCRQPQPFGRAS